jgi:hypothetical protein
VLGLACLGLIGFSAACQPQEHAKEQPPVKGELTVGRGTLTWVEAKTVPLAVFNRYQAELPTTPPYAIFQYARNGQTVYLFVLQRQSDQQWVLLDIGEKGETLGPVQTRETAPLLPTTQPASQSATP